MLFKIRITIFTIFCGLILMSSDVSAQITTIPKTPDKADKMVKPTPTPTPAAKDSEIELPEVEGWEKSDVQKYPSADLGYSVNYESEKAGRVTLYVYNSGKKKIASDVADKTIKDEMQSAKDALYQFQEAGYYQDVKEVTSETVTLGGTSGKVKALRAYFTLGAGGQKLSTDIYIFGYQNNFIKLRATRLKENEEAGKSAMTDLLTELDKLFSK